jgi:hypothetical protein
MFEDCGIPFLAAGILTRMNFDWRFELANFLSELTGDRFSISTITYPAPHRPAGDVAGARLAFDDFGELLKESYFAGVAGEYHSFEPRCQSDCQFAVLSAAGGGYGCSHLKHRAAWVASALPALEGVKHWRADARQVKGTGKCEVCPAAGTCRRCPAFLASNDGEEYCRFSRLAWEGIERSIREARVDGFAFLDTRIEAQLRRC